MSAHRFLFYQPSLNPDSESVTIDGEEHHHLRRVLRLSAGDETWVTNGRGLMARVRLDSVTRDASEATRIDRTQLDRAPRLTLALALLRKERFAQALEACVELGVTDCQPFVSAGCNLRQYSEAALERLRRVAITAVKQSFQAWLPDIHAPVSLGDLAGRLSDYDAAIVGVADAPPVASPQGDRMVVVGPEAGLNDDEVEALCAAGATPASVSANRLRSGTAAVALVAAVASPQSSD